MFGASFNLTLGLPLGKRRYCKRQHRDSRYRQQQNDALQALPPSSSRAWFFSHAYLQNAHDYDRFLEG
jgi:hypothetical protein